MKKILLALVLLAAVPAGAGTILLRDYDLDSTTYLCPVYCTPTIGAGPGLCPGPGYSDSKKITTSGASSATVTAVGSNGAFGLTVVGDLILVSPDGAAITVPTPRRVVAVASANSITVDSVITIATAGATFRLWNLTAGTGAAGDGWVSMPGTGDGEIFISVDQLVATGGVTYKVEGRMCAYNSSICTLAETLAGETNIPTATPTVDRVAFNEEYVDQVRVCFKIVTGDDGDDLTTNAEKINVQFNFATVR